MTNAASEGSAGAPTCYRHPHTVTYIRCQRCERHICVQCQTQAPVGVLCPECVHGSGAAANPSVARARRAWLPTGGDAPVATYGLIIANVLIFLLQLIPGLNLTDYLAYAPVYTHAEYAAIGAPFEPWRMITATFAHSTGFVFHILLNMYTLWIFGSILERMLGRTRFLLLYFISGFAGSLGVMYWAPMATVVVGASGAIFGLVGAFLIIQRKLGGDTTQLFILVGINLVIGFLPGLAVSWQAHLGGLIGGVILGLIFVQTRARSQRLVQVMLVAAAIVLSLVLCFAHAPFVV